MSSNFAFLTILDQALFQNALKLFEIRLLLLRFALKFFLSQERTALIYSYFNPTSEVNSSQDLTNILYNKKLFYPDEWEHNLFLDLIWLRMVLSGLSLHELNNFLTVAKQHSAKDSRGTH